MNINEIAELAGVSRATVSRYLNHGYISQEKRERVKKVIEETGYTPSSYAQTLRTKKTRIAGVIIPKINSNTIGSIVSGLSRVFGENGYKVLLAVTENDEKKELNYLQIFQENEVDGIVLLGSILTKEHKKLIKQSKVPVVISGQRLQGCSCVYQDEESAAFDITNYVIKRKGTKWGYIGVDERDEAVGTLRKSGFLKALESAKLSRNKEAEFIGPFQLETGYSGAKEIFAKAPDTNALFCGTDNLAIGALQYLKEIGKEIPKEVQVIGFGFSEIGQLVSPKITTVQYFYERSGEIAAKALLEQMEEKGKKGEWKEEKMPYQIISSESTCP